MEETSEEVVEKLITETFTKSFTKYPNGGNLSRKTIVDLLKLFFKLGVEWQQERSYSEEDMFDSWKACHTGGLNDESLRVHFNIWFEQFKKK